MKLHHREWQTLVVTHKRWKPKRASRLAGDVFSTEHGTWNIWDKETSLERMFLFRSAHQYFQLPPGVPSPKEYFQDKVFPRPRGGSIDYPVYLLSRDFGETCFLAVSVPYVGLMAEIFSKVFASIYDEDFAFVAPNILTFYEIARDAIYRPTPKSAREILASHDRYLVLRGGQVKLSVTEQGVASTLADVRRVVMAGANVLKSKVFTSLVDVGVGGARFHIDGSQAKVALKNGTSSGSVIRLDRFGNYHFRPGYGGTNLDSLADLLEFARDNSAICLTSEKPLGRRADEED